MGGRALLGGPAIPVPNGLGLALPEAATPLSRQAEYAVLGLEAPLCSEAS